MNWLAFAIPLFLFFIGLEYIVSKIQKKNYFRFTNSVANLNVGIAERLLDSFTVGLFYFVYDYLHRHYALFDIKASIWTWIGLLIATDFVWYWYHRLAHEMNVFWAVHVVHHQSDDFNYTVSARITVFQAAVRTLFWSVLPIIGFPAEMITIILLVHGLYPFFVHTRTIGKLGWLEYVFVTPSHHRVHHASNPEYLDKNYGDVLIIWDKLFGTFIEEKAEPVYGLTKPLDTHSFLWQHFHGLLEVFVAAYRATGWSAKLKVIFGRPDLIDPGIRTELEERFLSTDALSRSAVNPQSRRFRGYVVGQLASTLLILFVFLLFEASIPGYLQFLTALFILLTLINCGALLEQRQWVLYLEIGRVAILWLGFYAVLGDPMLIVLAYIGALSLWAYFSMVQKRYLRLVYGQQAIS
ncbi:MULTISPECIES: sterol desaturase family protein [unclassified Spirosoma]|uniref:sterol desaturase family protein n=1 Tax=unclassified Spirosoma TaxID=2621999 RepID=UPI0009648337|nr:MULTISPECIES: sterol desaturase family protein [unclassified Spirosoma]MBN8822697.1 sterol desaturase family protein [Spirosoma sp.]OJW79911.1 MAG: sterol desaturase [Spirosoma sp. 48-14]